MFQRSVLLATGFALTLAVAVPFVGGAGSVASASGQTSGSSIEVPASAVDTSVVGASVIGTLAAMSGPASTSTSAASDAAASTSAASTSAASFPAASVVAGSSTASSGQTTQSSTAVANYTAVSNPTVVSVSTGSNAAIWSSPSSQSMARGVTSNGNPVPGVTTRLAVNGTPAIVRNTVKTAPATIVPTPAKACPSNVTGTPSTVPGTIISGLGVAGTTNADLASFALKYNAIRVANCLPPIALANIRYDPCLQARMFWIAEDPSTNPASAWGHGVPRSDGKPIVGCDGDIAGGMGDTGTTAAQKWWDSSDHRQSLYQPQWGSSSYSNVCIGFAISHGGIPNDPVTFSRESARWEDCSTFGR